MRSAIVSAGLCAALVILPGVAAQQANNKGMPGMEMTSAATPPEKLAPPVAMTGIGNGTIKITTTNPKTQI